MGADEIEAVLLVADAARANQSIMPTTHRPYSFLVAAVAVLGGLEHGGWLGSGPVVVLMAMAACAAAYIAEGTAAPAPATNAPTKTKFAATVAAICAARRSVFPKDFTAGGTVPRRILEAALEAANWAPNHKARNTCAGHLRIAESILLTFPF